MKEYYIVSREKYKNYLDFGLGTFILKNGINTAASIFMFSLFYLIGILVIIFSSMLPVGKMGIVVCLGFFTLFILICPILLYNQRLIFDGEMVSVKIGEKAIYSFRKNEIVSIRKVRRFNGAYELRYKGGTGIRIIHLFTDRVPAEIEGLLQSA